MKVALIFFLLGVISGSIYGITKFIVHIFKKHILAQILLDLLFTLSSGLLFVFANIRYFYGEIRAYICIIFMLGMYLEQKTIGKLFAKLYLILYNWAITMVKNLKQTWLGKIIFK